MTAIGLKKALISTGRRVPLPIQKALNIRAGAELAAMTKLPTESPLLTIGRGIFPPLGLIPPPSIRGGAAALPQAIVESVFPPASFISGQLPAETLQKGMLQDLPNIPPSLVEQIEAGFQEGKPVILGGGTTVFEAAGVGVPSLPDLSGLGKKALIAAGLIAAGLFLSRR
jgi:hypothetical protein